MNTLRRQVESINAEYREDNLRLIEMIESLKRKEASHLWAIEDNPCKQITSNQSLASTPSRKMRHTTLDARMNSSVRTLKKISSRQ